jgi:hypothetical protein
VAKTINYVNNKGEKISTHRKEKRTMEAQEGLIDPAQQREPKKPARNRTQLVSAESPRTPEQRQ